MDKLINTLSKYVSASYRNKSSHWKLLLNNKKINNIYVNLGFGSFEKKLIVRSLLHYIFSRLLFGFKIFQTTEAKIYSDIFKKMNRQIDNDAIRHIFLFNLLKKNINPKKICVIGDGKANFILGALKIFPNSQIYSVNLAEVLIHDCLIINKFKVLNENLIKVVKKKEDIKKKNVKIFLVPSNNKNFLINADIDLFVNVASFQEMNKQEIKKYFHIIKSNNSEFYICNREKKILPAGEIIIFNNYPWSNAKFKFYENCKWYQNYYSFRFPFFRKYEGNIMHCYGFFKK
jgi:hypothetical protein